MASGQTASPCFAGRLLQIKPMNFTHDRGSFGVLGLLILLTLIIGGADAWATLPEIKGWYSTLLKPSFNPPNYLFGPVWTSLYLLMALSMWLVWKTPHSLYLKITFGVMLALNAAWSPLFFKFHQIGGALVLIGLYLIVLAVWVRLLLEKNKPAGLLQIPHLLWVCFATLLNTSIWWLNK